MNKKETEYERQQRIFAAALDLEQSSERASYLEEACGEDLALRESLEELVREYELGATLTGDGESSVLSGGDFDDTIDEKPGSMIGRYKLLEKIGEGGFGTVYMADQTEPVVRRVAVKVIKPGMDSKEIIARFEAERQALAMMDDPNIAKVLDAGATESGRPYFVMELVKGIPITQFCNERKLNTRQRLDIFMEVCSAVQHAHQKGIIHRDLKPSNVLVTLHGDSPMPKVIDFGIAKATQQQLTEKTLFTHFGQFVGTPAYMSPEQASMSAIDVDTRSDIYSLGVLLYELLAGAPPFDQKSLLSAGYDEMRRIIAEDEPPKPSTRCARIQTQTNAATGTGSEPKNSNISPRTLRGDLDCVVMKAIDKDRSRRYETANAFAADIGRVLEDEPVLAAGPSAAYKFKKFARRNKAAIGVAAAMVILLLGGIAATTWQAVLAKDEAKRANEAEDLAGQHLADSEQARTEAEDISNFYLNIFQSPDPEQKGHDIKVVELLESAASQLATSFADQPLRRAKLSSTLASTYLALGLPKPAVPLAEQVRDYYLNHQGPKSSETLAAMSLLATCYSTDHRHKEAIELGAEVVAILSNIYGPLALETLNARNSLGYQLNGGRRYEEAAQLFEEIVSLFRELAGPEDSGTLSAVIGLGLSYHHLGLNDQAIALYEDALPHIRMTRPEHENTLAQMGELGKVYREVGRFNDAIGLQEAALNSARKILGPQHRITKATISRLRDSYKAAGRQSAAVPLLAELLTGDPGNTIRILDLAAQQAWFGMDAELAVTRERMLEWAKDVNDPTNLNEVAKLACLSPAAPPSQLEAALTMARRSVKLGQESEWFPYNQLSLGIAEYRNGKHAAAEESLATAANLASSTFPQPRRGHIEGTAGFYQAMSLFRQGRKVEAHALFAATEKKITPLPLDDENPKVAYSADHDDLILWLAYKEAGALLAVTALKRSRPITTVLVPPDSEWRWRHPVDGVDPADDEPNFHTSFPDPTYDDSSWATGKDSKGGFGYGDPVGVDIGTPADKKLGKSAYFRLQFTTDKTFSNLELRCQRDDGIIVYLDGEELARDNMSDGPESYRLAAESNVNNDGSETSLISIALPGTLEPGEHVLAISLHNTALASSDLRIATISLVELEAPKGE